MTESRKEKGGYSKKNRLIKNVSEREQIVRNNTNGLDATL